VQRTSQRWRRHKAQRTKRRQLAEQRNVGNLGADQFELWHWAKRNGEWHHIEGPA
jgi:hypothetical protein